MRGDVERSERKPRLITGSFNSSKAAEENNAENLLVVHDPALAGKYAANWQVHQAHSELYTGFTPKKLRSR